MNEPRSLGPIPTVGLIALLAAGLLLTVTVPLTALYFLSYGCIGAVVALRRPRNPIGWLLIATAFGFIWTSTPPLSDIAAVQAGTASLGVSLGMWLSGWASVAWFLSFFALMVVFPNGRLPDGRWGVASRILLAIGAVLIVLTAASPSFTLTVGDGVQSVTVANPFAILPDLALWPPLSVANDVGSLLLVALLVVGVVSIIVRYRRSTGILRLQLRWLVAALTFLVVAILVGFVSIALFADVVHGLGWTFALIAFPTVPIAVGVAVLRYHLLEIDRIVSRTVGYAIVTGILAVVYGGSIVLLQTALVALTQAQTIAVAASTLVVLALFQPLRRRVQRAVDRRFDRARFDADRTTAAFAERVRDEVDIRTVGADLQETVRAAIQPTNLGLWLRGRPDRPLGEETGR